MSAPGRKLRVWNASLFALHAYGDDGDAARRRALRVLKRIDAKHSGALLIPTTGANREWTFFAATLARLEPDLFVAVESLEYRIDAVEDAIDEIKANERATVSQVLQVSRDIAKLRSTRNRAA